MRSLLALLLATAAWAKVGLTTTVPEADLGELELGASRSVAQALGRPYQVVNRGDAPLAVVFEAKAASEGAEPAWVSLSESTATLAPGDVAAIGVRVTVPKKRALKGRTFVLLVTARSVGDAVSVGVASRLKFKVKGGGRR